MRLARPGAAALLAVSLFATAGCAPKRAVERTPVAFWTSRSQESLAGALRAFEDANPSLRVVLRTLPASELPDSVEAALTAGRAPDLCEVGMEDLGPWLERGVLTDWSAGVADLRPAMRGWESCMVGDAIYAMPWTLRAPVLLYDRELLARANCDSAQAPDSWDAFRTAAGRVSRLRGGVRGFGIAAGTPAEYARAWLAWAPGAGGELVSSGLDSSRVASAANADALAFLQSLVPFSLVAAQDSLEREFVRGRLGLVLADPSLALTARAAGRNVGVAGLPSRGSDSLEFGPYASGEALVSFSVSRRKEDALRLARSLVDPASLEAQAAAEPDLLPARVGADTLAAFRGRADAVAALRMLATARTRPRMRDWARVEAHLGGAVEQVLAGRATPERALASADTFVTTHLGER